MKYNEYKASNGKVILDLNDFIYASSFSTLHDLEVIELTKEEAGYYHSKYEEVLEEQREQEEPEVEKSVEEQPTLLKGIKGLKAAAVEPADPVQRLKNLLKEEMAFKGYNLNNLVEPIIHELK